MLISMPTGTSTIFGVFQVIWVSSVTVQTLAPARNVKPTRVRRKGPRDEFLSEQSEQRPSRRRSQLFRVQCGVGITVGRVEAPFDNGKVLVQGQCAVMVGIGGGQLTRAQPASQFAFVERPVVIVVEPRKDIGSGFFDLSEIKRPVRIQIEHLDRIVGGCGQYGR